VIYTHSKSCVENTSLARCVCVCVHVRVRVSVRVRVCLCVYFVCMRVCARKNERESVCVKVM